MAYKPLYVGYIIFLVTLSTYLYHYLLKEEPIIVTLREPNGKFQAEVVENSLGFRYYVFRGIPYASIPGRFKEPVYPDGWEGVRTSTQRNLACMQDENWDIRIHPDISVSEDCLVLNVYTPLNPTDLPFRLPVLFWIHGGDFVNEFGAFYDPKPFMHHDIIVVTSNYRLGPFGFLTTEDGVIPGNLGLKDQEFALKWVHQNIDIFGGNASQITIGGYGAGAASVSYHILNTRNKALFRAAIQQSGTSMNTAFFNERAREIAFEMAVTLEPLFHSNSSEAILEVLQNAQANDILNAANKLKSKYGNTLWSPILENESFNGAYITKPMHASFINGSFNKVPLLTGFTSEESLSFFKDFESLEIAADTYDEDPSLIFEKQLHINESSINSAALELKLIYTNESYLVDLVGFLKALSNKLFTAGILRQAELAMKHEVPVYLYQFSYSSITRYNIGNTLTVKRAGLVGHGEDKFYPWEMGIPYEVRDDILLCHDLTTMLSNFIRDLNPIGDIFHTLKYTEWPVSNESLTYLDIGEKFEIKTNPKNYHKVRNLYEQYLQPPLVVF